MSIGHGLPGSVRLALRRPSVKELARYLLDNLYLDFQGDVSVETIRGFLREDDSRDARRVLSKIIEDKGIDDMLLVLADCLKETISQGVTDDSVCDQLKIYAGS